MALPRELTTVTFVSTTLSIVAFLIIPFIAFFSGVDYQKFVTPIGLTASDTSYGNYYKLTTYPTPVDSSKVPVINNPLR